MGFDHQQGLVLLRCVPSCLGRHPAESQKLPQRVTKANEPFVYARIEREGATGAHCCTFGLSGTKLRSVVVFGFPELLP